MALKSVFDGQAEKNSKMTFHAQTSSVQEDIWFCQNKKIQFDERLFFFLSFLPLILFILNLANFHPMVKGFELPIYLFATVKCQGCWNMSSCACPFFGRIQFFRTSNQRIMAQSFFKMRPYLFSTTLSHTFTSRPGPGIFLRECQQIANFQNPN